VIRAVVSCPAETSLVLLPSFPNPTPLQGEAVLFGFDETAFPGADGIARVMIPGTPWRSCIRPGLTNAPDQGLAYYGTVIRVASNDFRMWYLGVGADDGLRVCYATSKDGIAWSKPELGLVEFGGNKANNLIDFPVGPKAFHEPVVVLYDPEDPDPTRRFKMVFEYLPETTWGTAASSDGLRWRLLTADKLKPWLEMSGVTKYHGRYYVTGQGGFPQPQPWYRRVGVFVSDDFVTRRDPNASEWLVLLI